MFCFKLGLKSVGVTNMSLLSNYAAVIHIDRTAAASVSPLGSSAVLCIKKGSDQHQASS
jgi:hypothetical protein